MIDSLSCLTLAADLSELADCAATLQLTATLAAAAMVADALAMAADVPVCKVAALAVAGA